MRKLALLFTAAACLVLGATPAAAQATRTWVSGVGDDANPCSRTAPCKTFAGAISKTATAGEISVLDPGGFGGVTITKSISINGMWGGEAGVLVAGSGVNGIVVNAPADAIVNLRGLMIEGTSTASNGIRYLAGGFLHVQDSVIRGFRAPQVNQNGILVNPTAGNLVLDVTDTLIEDNGTAAFVGGGIVIKPTGAATVRVSLTRVQTSNNQIGLNVDGDLGTGAIDVIVRNSEFTRNVGDGISSRSPNNGDALVRITVADSNSSNNGAIGIHSVGQRSTILVGRSVAANNGAAGLQANNQGILQSYGDNMAESNGNPNAGITPAPPT